MSQLRFEHIEKHYGDTVAVEKLDLEVNDGEFLALLGPSGCGKTTTLRMIAGFVRPTAGRLLIDGEDVTRVPPQKRGIGMVFQDYALFPHLTIAQNIGFGLVERRVPRANVADRVAELLDLVHLPGVGARYPSQLSGGQQQRVALARAVAHSPRVLLMDEPLGALDLKLREAMQAELRRIQQALRTTTVYVTHDQAEAISMADRIAVMNRGRIEQLGAPSEIYDHPASRFVANFVGRINFVDGRAEPDGDMTRFTTTFGTFRAPACAVRGAASLAVRPERLRLQCDAPDDNIATARVVSVNFAGNLVDVVVQLDTDTRWRVELRPGDATAPQGAEVRIGWRPESGFVFGPQ